MTNCRCARSPCKLEAAEGGREENSSKWRKGNEKAGWIGRKDKKGIRAARKRDHATPWRRVGLLRRNSTVCGTRNASLLERPLKNETSFVSLSRETGKLVGSFRSEMNFKNCIIIINYYFSRLYIT